MINFNIGFGRRIVLFLCLAVLCFIVGSTIVYFITAFKGLTPATLRISAVIQDLFMFIIPAVGTAVMITRLPARFLCIEYAPSWRIMLMACMVLVVAMPALNALIAWNESLSLPASMADIEETMRNAEVTARRQIETLMGDGSVGATIIAILIVGVMAGLSEELFFRGTFQRLLSTGGVKPWVAVLVVAFIFSAIHMQFYGFMGRFALGAYFGLLLVWSRNLWIPAVVHIFNNTVYIIANRGIDTTVVGQRSGLDSFGIDQGWIILISIILTVCGLVLLRRMTRGEK